MFSTFRDTTLTLFSVLLKRYAYTTVSRVRMSSSPQDLKVIAATIIDEKEATQRESWLKTFCSQYKHGSKEQRFEFLQHLAKEYYINRSQFQSAVRAYLNNADDSPAFKFRDEERLYLLLTPQYTSFFHVLGRAEGGVKFLVDMRGDLLDLLSKSLSEGSQLYDVRVMNSILRELLSLWFAVGFIKLERITWKSSCEMLQKISEYEAVHPVRNWTDLKRRVGPYRRCYVFTHSCMPGEPIVVLHTALTNTIASSIQKIVTHTPSTSPLQQDWEDEKLIKAAIFYSISSTQKGLQGIELGKYLVKSVVREVKAEFPHIEEFCSLSPIPGFKDWVVAEIKKVLAGNGEGSRLFNLPVIIDIFRQHTSEDEPLQEFLKMLRTNGWFQIPELVEQLKDPLMKLCASYLYKEKHRGYALNSVANFHLKNGAMIWRLNWLGDVSPRGLSSSCSIMANYRYYLANMEDNRRRYLDDYVIQASDTFLEYLKPARSSL